MNMSQWNEQVYRALHEPPKAHRDPSEWNSDIAHGLHNLSGAALLRAIEIGRALDIELRSKELPLTADSLNRVGILPEDIRTAVMCVELVMHDPGCDERLLYSDRRRYGTRDGEQAIVDENRQLHAEKKSYRGIARALNLEGHLPRKGKWTNSMVKNVIEAVHGAEPSHPCRCRMYRTDWEKPSSPSVCIEILRLPDYTFEAMRAKGGIHRDMTENDVRRFRRSGLAQPALPTTRPNRSNVPNLNQVVSRDCHKCLSELPDGSVGLVITSPPYALQRWQYEGRPVTEYPAWVLGWMTALKPKLREDASVLIVIRAHVDDGELSDYVMRSVIAIREAGWIQPEELIWYKVNGPPWGKVQRPRRNFEHILWFSKSRKPYVDLRACGKPSDRIGLTGLNPHGNFHCDSGVVVKGTARITDVITTVGDMDLVIEACVGSVDRGRNHPAIFPAELVLPMIPTFAPPGSLIVDPFAGSGTVCLVAQALDYDFWGCDNGFEILGKDADGKPIYGESFADMANRRLATEAKYARGQAIRDRAREERLIEAEREAERTFIERLLSVRERPLSVELCPYTSASAGPRILR